MEDRYVEVGANYNGVSVYYQKKLVRVCWLSTIIVGHMIFWFLGNRLPLE